MKGELKKTKNFLIYDKNKFLKFDKNIYYLIKHYYI